MSRPSDAEFTNLTKARAFERDGGSCKKCTRKVGVGYEPAEFDHIKPVWEGGDASLDNCRTLCRECHLQVTGVQAGQRAKARKHQKKQAGIKPKPKWKKRLPFGKDDPRKAKIGGGWEWRR